MFHLRMSMMVPLFGTLAALLAVSPTSAAPVRPTPRPVGSIANAEARLATKWYAAMRRALTTFPKGGTYSAGRVAMEKFALQACRWDPRTDRPVFLPKSATPSFCSSACYLLILKTLELWDAGHVSPVIPRDAWLALVPRVGQADGIGTWGYANANGPGLAVLIHELKAGYSFEDWRQARPGDFMKIFWTDEIGGREHGHLTLLLADKGDQVTFWSSNIPDGYGPKTIDKKTIKRVIFTRITRPDRFRNAVKITTSPWLSTLLRKPVTIREVRQRCGM